MTRFTRQFLSAAVALTAMLPMPVCFADEAAPAETPQAAAAAPEVAEGPLLERRRELLGKIKEAKAKGVGAGGYFTAFQALEEQVKAGDGQEKIQARLESIHKGLADQLKRADMLKVQRPAPPQGSQITGSGPITGGASPAPRPAAAAAAQTAPGGAPDAGGGGGGIPAGLEDRLPAGIKEKLMKNPDLIRQMKEKLGG